MSFLNETHLEKLSNSISSYQTEVDINILFHLHASSLQHASKSNSLTWGRTVASTVSILFIIYYCTQFYIGNLLKNCFVDRNNTTDNSIQKTQVENLSPLQPNTTSVDCDSMTDPPTPQVRYSVYSLQPEA